VRNGNKVSDFSLIWKLIIFVKDIEPKIFLSFLGVTISSAIYTVLLVYLPKIIILFWLVLGLVTALQDGGTFFPSRCDRDGGMSDCVKSPPHHI